MNFVDLHIDQRLTVVRTVSELRAALEPFRRIGAPRSLAPIDDVGQAIGLVPTMGALHDGHLSLIRRARSQCAVVVVSLFVNPAQFDEQTDLDRYPRQEDRDAELAAEAGASILFVPSPEEVYPAGFATSVEVLGLTDHLEGKVRGAAHFKGVTTVVTKLLNMVRPDVAYFGQKDAQQVAVIKRLVKDLNMPVTIELCPTQREPDGVAMSSRNTHLLPEERARAKALYGALRTAETLASGGEHSAEALVRAAYDTLAQAGVEPEYVALVDPESFQSVALLDRPALLAIAARVGRTRLIDNLTLYPAVSSSPQSPDPREAQAICSA